MTSPLPVTSPSDAALLRRIAAAEAAWRALGQADVRRKALCAGTSCFDELPDKRAYLAAQAASRRAESRFRAACTDAYRDPAHSLRGLQARLALALRLTQEHDLLDHPPYDWLEAVLAELTHLTGHPTQASVLGASRQSIFQPATREVTA